MAEDLRIRDHITALVEEEHGLRAQLTRHEIAPAQEQARLRSLEVELDQC